MLINERRRNRYNFIYIYTLFRPPGEVVLYNHDAIQLSPTIHFNLYTGFRSL